MIDIAPAAPSPTTEHLRNVYSQFGEDGLLEEVFRRIGTTNQQCFECGAADGRWFSNTRKLIDEGWRAVLIEADPANWPELDKLDGPKVTVVHGKLRPSGQASLDAILAKVGFDAAPDLGVLDVDGQEYHLWNWMMKFRPRVMVVEYDHTALENPNFVPEIDGEGQAGLAALVSVACSKGYFNAYTTKTNAVFVLNSEREKFYAKYNEPPADRLMEAARSTQKTGERNTGLASAVGKEIKVSTLLSRPRFGLNAFFDCASEGLAPWGIPLQSFYGVFWGQHMQTGMEQAQEEGIDWVLCLDYDSMFTSKHLQKLIDAIGNDPNIDAIAALQVRRGRPLPIAVGENGQNIVMTGGPVKVRTAHFGLTLVKVEKLMKMPKPWFWSKPDATGSWGEGRLDDDIYFWGNWGDSGNSLYVHTGCKIGHVEEMVAHYDEDGNVQHSYITDWRNKNGHHIKSLE